MEGYKYIDYAANDDFKDHEDYLQKNLYNPKYKYLLGHSYYPNVLTNKKNDGWNTNIFNIVYEDKIIGMVGLSADRDNHVHAINGFYVREEYLGKGIGKLAMEEFIQFWKPKLSRLELNTPSKKLVEYYKTLGFNLVGKFTKRLKLSDHQIYDDYAMEIIFDKKDGN